jgi:predicted ATPase
MDAQVRRRRTLEAIKRILLRESLNQPLMVIFEDLHWIDEQAQELLNLLADSIGTAKILLLFNYRPKYSHQWNSKTYYTQLRLDPLGKESAAEMLTALIGDGVEVRPLKRLIVERTGGNPFFMEETVQVLLDEGALVRDGAAVRITKSLSELAPEIGTHWRMMQSDANQSPCRIPPISGPRFPAIREKCRESPIFGCHKEPGTPRSN